MPDSARPPDPALPEVPGYVKAISDAASAIASTGPEHHREHVYLLVVQLWGWMVSDAPPAVLVSLVNVAGVFLGNALDRLAAVDASSYVPALRETVSTLAARLPDGSDDPRDAEGGSR